ncbi:MAG: hypothetical protein JET69_06005 [Methanomassiliicoccales archaeon]|nr:hypothetical protein [Methanomassiliicoccales archaeon]
MLGTTGLPKIAGTVPAGFAKIFSPKLRPGMQESMSRRDESMEDVSLAAYNAFLWSLLVFAPAIAIVLLLIPYPLVMIAAGLVVAPFLFPALIIAGPSSRYAAEQRSFLIDTPAVIGAMGMSMSRAPSLERAVEMGTRSGDGGLQKAIASVAWKALTGEAADLRRGLSAWTSGLDKMNDGLRRALHLIMAAEESEGEGRERLLDRANSIALEGLKEVCERYIGSLSFPVMLVFAFGVLAPVMLFSLIPLLGMENGLVGGELNLGMLGLVLLFLVPAFTLGYIRSMMARNPLRGPRRKLDLDKSRLAIVLSSVPAALLTYVVAGSILVSALAGLGILLAALIGLGAPEKKGEQDTERSFVDALYRLGNAMLGGQDLERAFEEVAMSDNGEFRPWGLRLVHATRTDRVSLAEAIRADRELASIYPALHQNYLAVMACAEEDHLGAGKLAVNLAQSQGDVARAQAKVRENLRPVVDMMSTTSTLFAPAIIGLTGGIMGLIGGGTVALTAMASIYVVELAFIVNHFLGGLDGWSARQRGMRSYGTRGAIALGVYLTASLCGQTLLFHIL